MRKLYWSELTSEDFTRLDPRTTIAVQPVAAIEQHGPHLPVATDQAIAEGMIAEVMKRMPADVTALFLPTQAVGKSNEHIRSPGTLTFSAETAFRLWVELGESVARAGLRKMVFVNSHGGNADLLSVVARELRIRCNMMCVVAAWSRLGSPAGLYDAVESTHGIHAGDMETSMMLHFRPDLVKMDKAQNFVSVTQAVEKENSLLRVLGPSSAIGWIAQDLNAHGAAGDATKANADKGRQAAEFRAERFITLLREVAAYDLARIV